MKNTTGDRRTRKTNKAIKKALVKLMLENDINKITIKDIADEADINRGTFYFHFDDVYAVIEEIEDEIINKIYDLIDAFDFKSLTNSPLSFLLKLSDFLNEEREFNQLLFLNDSSLGFLNKLKLLVKNKMIQDNIKYVGKENQELFSCYIHFISSGTIDLYKEWFKGHIDMTLEELSNTVNDFIVGGAEGFINKSHLKQV